MIDLDWSQLPQAKFVFAYRDRGNWRVPVAEQDTCTADWHRRIVAHALSKGKPVPPEVLKDYPDLAK